MLDGTRTASIAIEGVWRDASGAPLVRGPFGGVVLYGRVVPGGIDMHVIDVETGDDHIVTRVPATAEDAELAPDGADLYWIDRSRANGGAWRADVSSGARARILAPVVVSTVPRGTVLVAAILARAQLALSDDGAGLAALWCSELHCVLQLIHLGSQDVETAQIQDTGRDLVGFAADGILLSGGCVRFPESVLIGAPCDLPDRRSQSVSQTVNFQVGVELPVGWTLEMVARPHAPQMSFELDAVAVPRDEGQQIVLHVLGIFFGNG